MDLIVNFVNEIVAILDFRLIYIYVCELRANYCFLRVAYFVLLENRVKKFDYISRPEESSVEYVLILTLVPRHLLSLIEHMLPAGPGTNKQLESFLHQRLQSVLSSGRIPFNRRSIVLR